ncbi:EF-hand domain-containing family member C2 isoform X1 [Manis javanica]|uniref:EF-hand domain-containing family member C2 isoform X1 n=1 Tax=Manis javanica TaxID=9974 RepID=UPI00187AC530|nr:EF-hand domain-containing family member C2 isoform X1 [Manis javanica]KAI5935620.1 EF-hand domain-containing family member C2 [Manis javanica]
MALPLLPGNRFNSNVGKEKFHKSQHWGFCNNVRMLVSEDKPGIGGQLLLGQKVKPKYSAFPRGTATYVPSWVAFDKQVLSFDAYVEDEVPDISEEKYRIRRYKIYFYPEDDTIQVNEPELKNSGLPQGTSIRRHRISLPPPDEDQFYTVYHFNVNIDIVFYGRTFKIYDCDTFTKNFLKKIGVKLNPPGQCPEDPYMKTRRKMLECMKPLRPYESFYTLKQFLEYDRKVLRFFCLWDDSDSFLGECRELILHYFLSDDTIEIKEVLPDNSGRHAVPFFLQRRKLPKYGPPGVYQPGDVTDQIVLNLCRGSVENRVLSCCLLERHKAGKLDQDFYKDSDLSIGTTINVWGRKVLLCDCDEFTKTYYKTKYGIENFTSIPCKAPRPPKMERKFPPYTNFGSEEDSLHSCIDLMPTPHTKIRKFMEKDRNVNISSTLRFFAKLFTCKCADVDRMFVISYFLSDDTVSVFEPIEKNSGITGGKFLKRSRVKKPGQEIFKSELLEYIKAEELYVGAKVNLNGYLFLLLNADEYTFNYMEKHSDKFPKSSIKLALQKLKEEPKSRELKKLFVAADYRHTKMVDYNTFRDILMSLTVGKLTDHEVITIARYYRVPEDTCPDSSVLIAQVREQLKKNYFENFERLIARCVFQDREKKKVLPSKDIKRLCKSSRLPLNDDLLTSLLSRFEDSEEQINYESFFCALNWRIHPMPALEAVSYDKEKCEDVWLGMPSHIPVKYINYVNLLKDVSGLEEE